MDEEDFPLTIEVKEVDLRNFILNHQALTTQSRRKYDELLVGNYPFFLTDLQSGRLNTYRGSFVVYHKGILCGQNDNSDASLLYERAYKYYGKSNLAVFYVPKIDEPQRQGLEKALGEIFNVPEWLVERIRSS